MKMRKTHQHAKGFTLLEMMVAIGILAVASAAVFFSNSEALQTQARLEEQTIAQWVLANQVAYGRLAHELELGSFYAPADISLAPQQINVAGLDFEITAVVLPTSTTNSRHIRWEVFRIVDGEARGPIRSLSAWLPTE